MNKDELQKIGLTDEQVTAVLNAHAEELKAYVPKSRLDEVIAERNGLKDQVKERDGQIETLKKGAGENAELKTQLEELQKQNATAAAEYEGKIAQIRLDNAVELAISGAKGKNSKTIKALLDLTGSKVGEDGSVEGLEAKIKAVQKSDPYLFGEATPATPKMTGVVPQEGNGNPAPKNPREMTYTELCAYMEAGGKVE